MAAIIILGIIIIRNGAKTIYPRHFVFGDIIIRNAAKTIYPRTFVFGDIIIIIRNAAKTIYPRAFVFGDIIICLALIHVSTAIEDLTRMTFMYIVSNSNFKLYSNPNL